MAAGRAFTADEERPGSRAARRDRVVFRMARATGLARDFVGSTVRANGRTFTVVGVAPRGFGGTMTLVSPQWWFPLGSYDIIVNEMFKQRASGLTDRGNYALNLAGAVQAGAHDCCRGERAQRRRPADGARLPRNRSRSNAVAGADVEDGCRVAARE